MTRPATDSVIDLGGTWEFLPRDSARAALPDVLPETLVVPGLWEANGHPRLDGAAWYRRRFEVADASGAWTLRFGAVMDAAEVFLNGAPIGLHDAAYTPFELAVGGVLIDGLNVLEVRVLDHPLDSREHRRRAHGKQGWMNGVFPSPPSLYGTYGGIWQPVTLRRHGPVAIDDLHVTADPADVRVSVRLRSHAGEAQDCHVRLRLLERLLERSVAVPANGVAELEIELGAVDAARWTPADPALHTVSASVDTPLGPSDERACRFGLRTFEVVDGRFLLNGEPLFLRAALVQGFRDDVLYAEGTREQIKAEVLAAKQAGLNMLRLHIKAFDPTYLEVCDDLGMLVHADIPVAEPVAHDELGGAGELAEACRQAVEEQVRRDRNHPSLVLWSLMNELGAEQISVRRTRRYEAFVRMLYRAAAELDPHRPIIENDWIVPDPKRVFCSPILTAHWYGRLSAPYLRRLADDVRRFSRGSRPLYVSEFGDWGLPAEDARAAESWWAADHVYEAIAALPWPGSVEDFVIGTQRYQGMSDRLQGEVVRAHGAAGWCVTELTDVPHEYNGLWTLGRDEKPASLAEITRLCQAVLPVVPRTSWTAIAGAAFTAPLVVCNDGPAVESGELTMSVGGEVVHVTPMALPAATVVTYPELALRVPAKPGEYTLDLTIIGVGEAATDVKAANSYPLIVVEAPNLNGCVLAHRGSRREQRLLAGLGAQVRDADSSLLLVGADALDARAARELAARLARGEHVVVLAQRADAAGRLPFPARAVELATEWGSTPFLFTTGHAQFAALPRRRVLAAEAMGVTPDAVWTDLGGTPWAHRTMVGVYKPYPGEITGTVVGQVAVDRGSLWLCQLPVTAHGADTAAHSILAELVRAATS